jgi:hypothetical protein
MPGKFLEFGGFFAVVNGRRTEATALAELCSEQCAVRAFTALMRKVAEATAAESWKPGCHSLSASDGTRPA